MDCPRYPLDSAETGRRAFSRPLLSILGSRRWHALRGRQRLAFEELESLLELEILFRSELERGRGLLITATFAGRLCRRFLRRVGTGGLVLVVEKMLLQVRFAEPPH